LDHVHFEKTITVPTSVDRAWEVLMDMPAVGTCVPGLEAIEATGDDRYRGVMKVKVGAIRVRFDGDIQVVETNRGALRARMKATGNDKRVGGAVNAVVDMSLRELSAEEVSMSVIVDASVLGKLGELGQAVMLRKADQVMTQFAQNLARQLQAEKVGAATDGAGSASGRTVAPGPTLSTAAAQPKPPTVPTTAKPGLWARIVAWFRGRRARA
jgi:uncharacterized protein